jgi:hypothetical protein
MYPSFFIGLFTFWIVVGIETNIMLILLGQDDILNVMLKFVSLAAINQVPKFFFASLSSHKASGFGDIKLSITKLRSANPLENAHWSLKVLRFIYKTFRIFFCSFNFYFMPYLAIIINF